MRSSFHWPHFLQPPRHDHPLKRLLRGASGCCGIPAALPWTILLSSYVMVRAGAPGTSAPGGEPVGLAVRQRRDVNSARSMLREMARPATLWAAWARVAAGSGMAGADGVEVAEFAHRLGPRLELLSRLLLSGEYQPQPVRLVLARRAGKVRRRGVPTVADRITQRAFLQVCGSRLEAARAEVSFAYRRGRSWVDALARAGRYRARRCDPAPTAAAVGTPG